MKNAIPFFIGAGVSALLGIFWFGWPDPAPYKNVELISYEQKDGYGYLVASFEKTDCEFEQLVVLGEEVGHYYYLDWKSYDGQEGDRIKGHQVLSLEVDLKSLSPSSLEVRTRHICDGKVVDKVFLDIVLPKG